jgi:putative ATP-dependent endonuclease of OLD family
MAELFKWGKGKWILADFLSSCSEEEIPQWLRDKASRLKSLCIPQPDDEIENPNQAEADAAD